VSGGVLTEDRVALVYEADAPTDIDGALADLVALRDAQDALKDWEGVLTDFLAEHLSKEGHQLPDGRTAQVRRGRDRTEWDTRSLVRAVLDSRCRPDPETGEAAPSDDGRAEIKGEPLSCSQDLARVLHVWNLGAPRVTALRDRGIDPDEFCASSPGRVSVVIQ